MKKKKNPFRIIIIIFLILMLMLVIDLFRKSTPPWERNHDKIESEF